MSKPLTFRKRFSISQATGVPRNHWSDRAYVVRSGSACVQLLVHNLWVWKVCAAAGLQEPAAKVAPNPRRCFAIGLGPHHRLVCAILGLLNL